MPKKETSNMDKKETKVHLLSNFKKLFRPKDIPAIVPDCGWNHGEDTDNVNYIDKTDKK